MRVRTLVGVSAVLLAGCSPGPEPVRACTMIGCDDGLEVAVEGAPATGFRVEASAPGAETRVFECPRLDQCGGRAFFAGFTPESVVVRVIAGADTTTHSLRPEYRTLQPNGAGCPPTCRQGTVRIVHGAGGVSTVTLSAPGGAPGAPCAQA